MSHSKSLNTVNVNLLSQAQKFSSAVARSKHHPFLSHTDCYAPPVMAGSVSVALQMFYGVGTLLSSNFH